MASEVEVPSAKNALQFLNKIVKRPTVDIEFQNLSYLVRDGNFKGEQRQILHSINGKFRSGKLTGILGPSGAGKTTLLNILAGFIRSDVQGTIKLNNVAQDSAAVNKLSTYIMQENIVQPFLTVKESMLYAAGFKLGPNVKYRDKMIVIEELTHLLGLEKCMDTLSESLSGGERKRLAIALELFNNPPILFLDEPTTGLDSFTVKQCISCLKKISDLNCTVVVTIHQPSASLLQSFDLIYILADGYCIYNGPPTQLIPFLSVTDCPCPPTHTPSEYVIELVAHIQPSTVAIFKEAIKNGSVEIHEMTDEKNGDEDNEEDLKKYDVNFSTPFRIQFSLLLSRMWLQMRRNLISLYLQIFTHVALAVMLATMFSKCGNDASRYFSLLMYCMSCEVCITYIYTLTPAIIFPLEMKMVQKEYFNRWYSLKAYYSALIISKLPLLITLSVLFCTIVYFWTDQPMEMDRYVGFCLIIVSISCISQALGHTIGSIFEITTGSVVAPLVLALFVVLAYYGLDYKVKSVPFFRMVADFSFIRAGLVGLCNALFYKRKALECHQEFCHYVHMETVMKHLSVPIMHYKYQLIILWTFVIVFVIAGYIALKCRLNIELSSKLHHHFSKITKLRLR